MVQCPVVVVGKGLESGNVALRVRYEGSCLSVSQATSLLDIYHPDPWHAPVAATTVFSTPDDGRRKRPKHVE